MFVFQTGVNKLADLVGVTLGPKGRNVVLESKYGSPKIVNDGVTVAKEVLVPFICNRLKIWSLAQLLFSVNKKTFAAMFVRNFCSISTFILNLSSHKMKLSMQVELEDPVENIGAKLVRQAASKTNDMAGDGTTTSVVLAQGLINEGVKV